MPQNVISNTAIPRRARHARDDSIITMYAHNVSNAQTHTLLHTLTRTHTHTQAYAHTHTHTHTCSYAHTHTRPHTHAYAHTHTRSYIHTHTWISSSHRCLCATSITSSACAARMATMRAPTSAASFTRCWMAAAGRSLKSAPPKPPGLCNVHKQVNSPRSKGPRSRAAGWQLQGAR